jgi:hypothetical protein
VPGVAENVNLEHVERRYYGSRRTFGPSGVVPPGPAAVGFIRIALTVSEGGLRPRAAEKPDGT